MNPMYTFRETIDLGPTQKTMQEIRSIIQQLKQEWPGARQGAGPSTPRSHMQRQQESCSSNSDST